MRFVTDTNMAAAILTQNWWVYSLSNCVLWQIANKSGVEKHLLNWQTSHVFHEEIQIGWKKKFFLKLRLTFSEESNFSFLI